jgi:2-dehydropantoate 2-reductase
VHGRITQRIEELGAMIRTVTPRKVTDNLWGERWSKLCVNGMHNGVSAAAARPATRSARTAHPAGHQARRRKVRVGQALATGSRTSPARRGKAGAHRRRPRRPRRGQSLMLALRNSQQRKDTNARRWGRCRRPPHRIDFINGVIVGWAARSGCRYRR